MLDFQELRKEYEDHGIDEAELGNCPYTAFRSWLKIAAERAPGPWLEPNAMTLATSDQLGHVTARTVLLKALEDGKFKFYTNYESEKGTQLLVNPKACLLFHWPHLGRQVRIDGHVERTSRADSEAYFHSRPRGAQLGAAASQQSQRLTDRTALEERVAQLAETYLDSPIPLPEHWGGFALLPDRIEFWQGRSSRLHDRLVFHRQGESHWERVRLSP